MRATLANVSATVHHARLTSAREIADGVVEYDFALADEDRDLRWRPGQFISITCGQHETGEPVLRSYSLANRPGEGRVVLVLKLVEGGSASEWFRRLPVGSAIRFTGPMGFFVLELAHPGDALFAATGTGIAPMVPMIAEMLDRDERGRIHLHWGLRAEPDVFWLDEIAALERRAGGRLATTLSLSQPSASWSGARGRITARVLEQAPALDRPTFYLCGNGAMIREVKAGLVERGVDRKRQIRTEAFFD
jgi:ferredoxin-NADP reductase